MNKLAAFIPMRHASERVKGKNYRDFAGKPLFHHVVQTLLNCPHITQVCIDTDSPVITEDVQASFPSVKVLLRTEHLRDGEIPMNTVLKNSISQVNAAWYLQTRLLEEKQNDS